MKLANLFLITALVGVLGAIGGSDDTTGDGGNGGSGTAGTGGTAGPGGTAGTGGTAGSGGEAGNGGTGGDPFDPVLCNRDACVSNETLRLECEMELAACSLLPDLQQEECIVVALATCNPE